MKTINITTHFIHSRGFSFVEETCGRKKMRAPLLGLPKSIYYTLSSDVKPSFLKYDLRFSSALESGAY